MAKKTFSKKIGRGIIESTQKSLLSLTPIEKRFRKPKGKLKTGATIRTVAKFTDKIVFDVKLGKTIERGVIKTTKKNMNFKKSDYLYISKNKRWGIVNPFKVSPLTILLKKQKR